MKDEVDKELDEFERELDVMEAVAKTPTIIYIPHAESLCDSLEYGAYNSSEEAAIVYWDALRQYIKDHDVLSTMEIELRESKLHRHRLVYDEIEAIQQARQYAMQKLECYFEQLEETAGDDD
jgi:hypothetical protein